MPESRLPDFLKVIDQLTEIWTANLPLNVPNQTRLAKFKVICNVAFDLYLSSIAVSLERKSSRITEAHAVQDESLGLPSSYSTPVLQSPSLRFYPLNAGPSSQPTPGLITPRRTPSLQSHPSPESTSKSGDDAAISRLRQYAISVEAHELAGSELLAQWPLSPGRDPGGYSWEAAQSASKIGVKEHNARLQKEETRRRQQTQKLLKQATATAATQERTPFGTQPVVSSHVFSSQAASEPRDDIPMTQPDRGRFYSRPTSKVNQGQKKRKAGF